MLANLSGMRLQMQKALFLGRRFNTFEVPHQRYLRIDDDSTI